MEIFITLKKFEYDKLFLLTSVFKESSTFSLKKADVIFELKSSIVYFNTGINMKSMKKSKAILKLIEKWTRKSELSGCCD